MKFALALALAVFASSASAGDTATDVHQLTQIANQENMAAIIIISAHAICFGLGMVAGRMR